MSNVISDVIGLVTGSILTPPADDAKLSLARRFKGRKVALFSYGSKVLKFSSVTFPPGKKPLLGPVQSEPFDLGRGQLPEGKIARLKTLTDCKSVIILIGDRAGFAYRGGLRKMPPVLELVSLAGDASQLLGAEAEKDKRYALLHHTTHAQSIELSVDQAEVDMLYQTMGNLGLTVARIQSSTAAVLSGVLASPTLAKGGVVVVLDHSAATAVSIGASGEWVASVRHVDNAFRENDQSRVDRLLNEVKPKDATTPFLVVDTGTSDALTAPPAGIQPFVTEALPPGAAAIEFYFAVLESETTTLSRGLGHEFGKVNQGSDALPPQARLVQVGFLAACVGLAGWLGYQIYQTKQSARAEQAARNQLPALQQRKADLERQESEQLAVGAQAEVVNAWLDRTTVLQPLMCRLAAVFDERVRIASLSITRATSVPGAYQLNLVYSCEAKFMSGFHSDLSKQADVAGWSLTTLVSAPSTGLFNYTALLTPKSATVTPSAL